MLGHMIVLLWRMMSSFCVFQVSMDEMDSGIGDIASYTNVHTSTNNSDNNTATFQQLLDQHQHEQHSSNVLDTSTGLMDTSSGGLMDTSSGMMDTSSGLMDTSSGVLDSSGTLLSEAGDGGVTKQEDGSAEGDLLFKNLNLTGAQLVRTSTGQFILRQNPLGNNFKVRHSHLAQILMCFCCII